MRPAGLAGWVADAHGADVLPQRHAGEAGTVTTPLTLLDTLDLSPGVLAVVSDAAGRRFGVPLVEQRAGWRRAKAGDGIAAALAALVTGETAPGTCGSRFDAVRWASGAHWGDAAAERAIDVDQTNESVVVGSQVVVKWTVRSSAGPEPAPDRLAALVAAGFTDTPRPWGLLRWRADDSAEAAELLVATVVAYLPGARDGWEWAVGDVRALARGALSMPDAVAPWSTIGDLVARMHLALPARGVATSADARRWCRSALDELGQAVEVVDGPEGARLRGHAPRLRRLVEQLGTAAGTALQDVHGDLHVGQLLRWQAPAPDRTSYAVTDFDGNPVLTPQERLAPAPAAVDVAGLVQSLDHVARVVSHHTDYVDPGVVAEWIDAAQTTLLTSYRDALGSAGQSHRLDESLLPALRARQVVREFLYAARHLPHWRYVPDAALAALVGSEQTPGRPVRGPTDQA